MTKRFALGRRRLSRLGDLMRRNVVEDARRMTPEERVRLAVELSMTLGRLSRAGHEGLARPAPP
jgi:hypothetical protein